MFARISDAFRRSAADFRSNVASGGFWSDVRRNASFFLRIGCTVYVARTYGIETTACVGPSMLPTFNARGDLLLQEYPSVYLQRIQVGDVVISHSPQNPRHVVCKRVLGLAGDTVQVARTSQHGPTSVQVPEGHVWLQGDNTLNSTDSRHYGAVPYALLKGRAFLKIWPPWEAGWIESRVPSLTAFSRP